MSPISDPRLPRGIVLMLGSLLAGCAHEPADRHASRASCVVDGVEYPADEDGFGCSTAVTLRMMVADPADLERPQPLAPAQGDAAIAPARRYRLDQVKPLPGAAATGDEPLEDGVR